MKQEECLAPEGFSETIGYYQWSSLDSADSFIVTAAKTGENSLPLRNDKN